MQHCDGCEQQKGEEREKFHHRPPATTNKYKQHLLKYDEMRTNETCDVFLDDDIRDGARHDREDGQDDVGDEGEQAGRAQVEVQHLFQVRRQPREHDIIAPID